MPMTGFGERRGPAVETLVVSRRQLQHLRDANRTFGAGMTESEALPHLIRTILERAEESGLDLAAASSEEEIALLATQALSLPARRRVRPSATLSS